MKRVRLPSGLPGGGRSPFFLQDSGAQQSGCGAEAIPQRAPSAGRGRCGHSGAGWGRKVPLGSVGSSHSPGLAVGDGSVDRSASSAHPAANRPGNRRGLKPTEQNRAAFNSCEVCPLVCCRFVRQRQQQEDVAVFPPRPRPGLAPPQRSEGRGGAPWLPHGAVQGYGVPVTSCPLRQGSFGAGGLQLLALGDRSSRQMAAGRGRCTPAALPAPSRTVEAALPERRGLCPPGPDPPQKDGSSQRSAGPGREPL